ncbi:tyrosine-type recombinase/integrase [Peribacillus sp. NPDC096540]|uniref:tyrosine-type recombinase/integrase n=1 Tax=Peribacillus sp. NPDC096540 TaxID=3390612 RepID=UPI003D089A6F
MTLTGPNRGKPMTDGSVRSLIKRMKKKTGIDFAPHILRHTYVTELHEAGVDIKVIRTYPRSNNHTDLYPCIR